jgi:hypothetical protein
MLQLAPAFVRGSRASCLLADVDVHEAAPDALGTGQATVAQGGLNERDAKRPAALLTRLFAAYGVRFSGGALTCGRATACVAGIWMGA